MIGYVRNFSMEINNIKGLIWDLDGTLIDSFGVFIKIIEEVVEVSGHQMPSQETVLHNYHGSLEDTVKATLGISSIDELKKVVSLFLEKQDKHYASDLESHLFQDALNLANACARQSIDQLVVTNRANGGRGPASPKTIIASTALADCIHEVRASDEVEFRKPDKRSVGDWLERHSLNPANVLVIGDQYVDAQLALNLGAQALLIKRNGDIPHLDSLGSYETNRVRVVDNLEDIQISTS